MKTVWQIVSAKGISLGLLQQTTSHLHIDQAIFGKIDLIEHKPKRTLLQFMSEKIPHKIIEKDCVSKILKVAEHKTRDVRFNNSIY